MPKSLPSAKHPSSPGLAQVTSVDERDGPVFSSVRDATTAPNPAGTDAPPQATNGSGREATSQLTTTWPSELDAYLKKAALSPAFDERSAIEAIRASYPSVAKGVIWERIVYLGLTSRKRPPYDGHQWTDVEDEILRGEYGDGRKGANAATKKILALHPDWSHDAVARRAQVLGLTRHRASPPQRWDQQLDEALRELADCKLETIARRLGRSPKSILSRIRRLGFDAGFFGGQKTKDLVRYFRVTEAKVRSWVRRGWLERKRRRITDDSVARFCQQHPELIPFDDLLPEAQNWVLSMGYPKHLASTEKKSKTKNAVDAG